jgi:hypothetical protein
LLLQSEVDQRLETATQAAARRPDCGVFFSLGGLVAPLLPARMRLVPWLLAAIALASLGCWDRVARDGPFDTILLGLAAYELLIALTLLGDEGSGTDSGQVAPPETETFSRSTRAGSPRRNSC